MKKCFHILLNILLFAFLFVSLFLFFFDRWLFATWAKLSYDEIVFQMKSSVGGTNPEMVWDALLKYALPTALIFAAVLGTYIYFYKKNKKVKTILGCAVLGLGIFMTAFTVYDMQERLNIIDNLSADFLGVESNLSTFIGDNYVNPAEVEITFPEEKRNLVYIYLESVEETYADKENGGAFEENVIPNLTALGEEYVDFSGGKEGLNGACVLPGTDWTMGGMFAQTAGSPLKLSVDGNSMEYADSFFPSMVTLGDILKSEGYTNYLSIGSRADFAGRATYFKSHGDYEIHDYDYAVAKERIPEDYYEFWGFEDEKLFSYAKEELTKIAKKGEPFNYTLLTVDTHFEDGYVCDLCGDEFGDDQYANVFACSDRQVSEFVKWIQEQGFYENTTVILCGDHVTMDSDFCQDVPKSYERKAYMTILNSAMGDEEQPWRDYSTLDMFPTTLATLGATIDGNRLGLGANLYSDEKTIVEEFGINTCKEELECQSKFLEDTFGQGTKYDVEQMVAAGSDASGFPYPKGNHKFEFDVEYDDYMFETYEFPISCKLQITDTATEKTKTYKLHQFEDTTKFTGTAEFKTKDITKIKSNVIVTINKSTEISVPVKVIRRMTELSEDEKTLTIYYFVPNDKKYDVMYFPTWTVGGETDNTQWFQAEKMDDYIWKVDINFEPYADSVPVFIDVYGTDFNGNQEKIERIYYQ